MNKNIKIIIGPAKTFNTNIEVSKNQRPKYLAKAKHIFLNYLKDLPKEEIEKRYSISEELAAKVFKMHQEHGQKLYNSIEVFNGMVFKELELDKYSKEWVNNHVMIIDPLYGPLRPYESIGLYRLDMKTNIDLDISKYWIEEIQNELKGYEVINLASQEWTSWLKDIKLINPILDPSIKQIKKARGKKLNELILKYQSI